MDSERILEALFAAGVFLAAGDLAAIAWGLAGRAAAAVVSTALGTAAAAAWAVFALDPRDELALAAGGLTACLVAALAGLPLQRALARARRVDAEIARSERRLRDVGTAEAAKQADELERLLARSRADTLSDIAKEERRVAEERRRELADRERKAGADFAAALAVVSLAGAAAIGVAAAFWWTPWLLVFVAFGVFLVPAYNLELGGGRFHNSLWFAVGWGAFPALTGYFAAAETLRVEAVAAAAYAALLSYAQRVLSTPVRTMRRRVRAVAGEIEYADGSREPVTDATLLAAPERALQVLGVAAVAIAVAVLLAQWA